MSEHVNILGIVQGGLFRPSVPSGREQTYAQLTQVEPQAAIAPEAEQIDLSPYEGKAVMVNGLDQGSWIYTAKIVDVAGPILTAVVERLTGLSPGKH